ncbi:hypothetical protein BCR37DRAFT_336191, partial [Protomyces lactucae-debilis]
YTAKDIPDQTGKVILVTGGNTGIGYETCLMLAQAGAKVYLAARSEARANAAIEKIRARNPKGTVQWLKLDLQDLESVRSAAQSFSNKESKLDALFNNAGIMATPYQLTKDGIEEQFQTNHVGPFYLTRLLLGKLERADDPRIVNTSSFGHRFYTANAESFTSLEEVNKTCDSTWTRYGQSKLANILFAMELAKRHPKIMSNAVHPGFIDTELSRGTGASYGKVFQTLFDWSIKLGASVVGVTLSPPEGALTQLYVGTAKKVRTDAISGRFFVPIAK